MIFFVVDFTPGVPVVLQGPVEEKVRSVLVEPPKEIFMVKVVGVRPSCLGGVNADFACRVTVCGVGGVPIPKEPEFILYRTPSAPDQLGYQQI